MPELRNIAMHDVDEPPLPVRESMDEGKLRELADSMASDGLIQPLTVVERGGRYEIVAGHRRYMAAQLLAWREIPALVHEPGKMDEAAVMLAENLLREDITAAEEAIFLAQVMEAKGVDTLGLVNLVHQKRDWIEDRLRLLNGDKKVFDALRQRDINFGVARELNKITDDDMRRYYLDAAVRTGAKHRTVAQWVTDWKISLQPAQPAQTQSQSTVETPAAPAYVFECAFCGGSKDPHNITPVNIHRHCWDAMMKAMDAVAQAQ